eukprot:3919144-Prymnesium_polylepis.1
MQNARVQPPTPRTWACMVCTRSHQRAGRPHPHPPHKPKMLTLSSAASETEWFLASRGSARSAAARA